MPGPSMAEERSAYRLGRIFSRVVAVLRPGDGQEPEAEEDVAHHSGCLRLPQNAGFGQRWPSGRNDLVREVAPPTENRGSK
jgi:hypothetical protein